jgi:hypothetical protein
MDVISKKSNAVCLRTAQELIFSKIFKPTPLPTKENITFLMIGRLLISKGVREFFQASLTIHQKYPDVQDFYCLEELGEDDNPDAISP